MQFVGKMITSVSEFYKDINPSTLSGAIDVLVVEDAETGQLTCSPFHVRFGKLQLLRPQEKIVEMRVNGRLVDVKMKVGEAGETFFVLPSAKAVPEEWATSPLAMPIPAAGSPVEPLSLSPVKGAGFVSSDQEVEDYQDPFRPRRSSSLFGKSLTTKASPSLKAIGGAHALDGRKRVGALSDSELEVESHSAEGDSLLLASKDALELSSPITTDPNMLPVGSPPRYSWMWGGLPQKTPNPSSDKESPSTKAFSPPSPALPAVGSAEEKSLKSDEDPEIAYLAKAFADHSIQSSSSTSPAISDAAETGVTSLVSTDTTPITSSDTAPSDTTQMAPSGMADIVSSNVAEPSDSPPAKVTMTATSVMVNGEHPAETPIPEEGPIPQAPQLVNIFEYVNRPSVFRAQYEALAAIPKEESLQRILIVKSFKPQAEPLVDVGRDPLVSEMLAPIKDSLIYLEWSAFADDPTGLLSELTSRKTLVLINDQIIFSGTVAQSLVVGRVIFGHCMAYETLLKKFPFLDPTTTTAPAKKSSWRWWSRSSAPDSIGTTSEGEGKASPMAHKEQPGPLTATSEGSPTATPSKLESLATTATLEASPTYYTKSLRLPHEMLEKLELEPGVNSISFTVITRLQGTATCNARIFRWSSNTRIVISDVDGTITKSDALGHLFAFVGRDWTHCDIAKLYSAIANNGYRFVYLTSRSLGQANITRGYLRSVEQNGRFQLPDGPVIMSPDRLLAALRREVVLRNPQEFKIACLRDIQQLFCPPITTEDGDAPANPPGNPFWAGFGNRTNDAHAYTEIGIPPPRIFIVDATGRVAVEPLVDQYSGSYGLLIDLVDQIFPPIIKAPASPEEESYNDFWYWRRPLTVALGMQDVARLMNSREGSTDGLSLDGDNRRGSRVDDDELEEEEGLVPAYYV